MALRYDSREAGSKPESIPLYQSTAYPSLRGFTMRLPVDR